MRPLNVAMMSTGVLVGYLLADSSTTAGGADLLRSILAVAAVGAASNSLNDRLDIVVDRINRPDRPLAVGAVSKRVAELQFVLLALLGLALALIVSLAHALFAAVVTALLIAYSAYLKRTILIGNIAVAAAVGATLLFGAMSRSPNAGVVFGALLAFLLTLSREVAKDIEDLPGDREAGFGTLPIRWGVGASRVVVVGSAVLALVAVVWPYLYLGFSGAYLGFAFGADACLLLAAWQLGRGGPGEDADSGAQARKASRWLKVAMVLGLLGLALAGTG